MIHFVYRIGPLAVKVPPSNGEMMAMNTGNSKLPPDSLGQYFSRNLSAVLAVAGAQRETERDPDAPGPFSSVQMLSLIHI